jgi:hypothetical protein
MFNLFKRKKKVQLFGWEKELFKNIFTLLGNEYSNFEKQISEGIIESVRFNKDITDFISFKLNVVLLNKFEIKKEQLFTLKGIQVYDKTSCQYKHLKFEIGYGLILGYSVSEILNFNPDINKIKIHSAYKIFVENDDFKNIQFLFNHEELNLLNASDVYKIELNGKIYYHLKDLEDGDFIGIDRQRNIYLITHDPFKITLQNNDLNYYLNNY